jgi:hypothetical protein
MSQITQQVPIAEDRRNPSAPSLSRSLKLNDVNEMSVQLELIHIDALYMPSSINKKNSLFRITLINPDCNYYDIEPDGRCALECCLRLHGITKKILENNGLQLHQLKRSPRHNKIEDNLVKFACTQEDVLNKVQKLQGREPEDCFFLTTDEMLDLVPLIPDITLKSHHAVVWEETLKNSGCFALSNSQIFRKTKWHFSVEDLVTIFSQEHSTVLLFAGPPSHFSMMARGFQFQLEDFLNTSADEILIEV